MEVSFAQMEGHCYRCGAKGHLSNKCTKNVPSGQWYMDKIKLQDKQLTQTSGNRTSTNDDWSTVMGSTPATIGLTSQDTTTLEVGRPPWQCLQIHKSGTIYTHSYVQTNKYMYDWIFLNTCSSIDLYCN